MIIMVEPASHLKPYLCRLFSTLLLLLRRHCNRQFDQQENTLWGDSNGLFKIYTQVMPQSSEISKRRALNVRVCSPTDGSSTSPFSTLLYDYHAQLTCPSYSHDIFAFPFSLQE